MRVGFAISITTKIAWILVFWPKWFKILSYYDWIWINFNQILKYWKKSENCRGDLCLSALSKTTEIPNTGWEIKMNTWKHNGNEAKFRGQKILLKYAHADFGPVTNSISSLSLNPWPNPNSPSSSSNGETGRRAHRIGPKSRCPNPNRPRIPDPAPTPDDWFSLSFFFLTANSNFAADRNLPFSTARRRRHHGHGGESDRLRRATRPQATRRPLPPPVRAVAAVEARRGLERGRQPDPLPAAGHAAAAAAGAGAGRRAGHHQGGALRAGGSARRPRRARRRQAPTQILFIIWYCDMILSIGRPTWKVSWI